MIIQGEVMNIIQLSLAAIMSASIAVAGGDIKPVTVAEEPPETEVDYGTIFGQSRTFYLDRTYTGSINNNRNALATGGYVGYTSPVFSGFSATVALYGTYGFDIHDRDADDIGSASYDPALYGSNFKNYGFLGQAYLNYDFGNTNIRVGRQKLDTPLAGSDDARMLPNLFEAAVITNKDIVNTTLILGHITKETVGTFGNVYPTSLPSLSISSGYGYGYVLGTNGHFTNMGEIALGSGADTDGVTAAAIIYKGFEGLTLTAWDYYAHDILNALYLQADYGWTCTFNNEVKMNASVQYINETEVGDKLAGEVDSNYWAAKLGATYGNLSAYIAYSQTGDSNGAENGAILTPWGGMPAFTQGMVTRHQFFADTDTWKVAASYNFAEYNLKTTGYFTSFDVGDKATYATGLNTKESGFDFIYQASKALQLRFRGNFPTDFGATGAPAEPYDWCEYRFIVNYTF